MLTIDKQPPAMTEEITMTLLEDLRTAISAVLKNTLPSLPVTVELMTGRQRGLVVRVGRDAEPRYPGFVDASAVVRPQRNRLTYLGLHTLPDEG